MMIVFSEDITVFTIHDMLALLLIIVGLVNIKKIYSIYMFSSRIIETNIHRYKYKIGKLDTGLD